jgi:hypothetical protein
MNRCASGRNARGARRRQRGIKQPGVPDIIINQDIGVCSCVDYMIVVAVAGGHIDDHASITLEHHHHAQHCDTVYGIPEFHISRIPSQAKVIHSIDKILIQE